MSNSLFTNGTLAALAVAGAAFLAGTGSLEAQELDLSFGVFAGGFTTSDLNAIDEEDFFTEDNPGTDLDIETSGMVGGQAELWFTDRFAVRANGAYSPATLVTNAPDDALSDVPQGSEVADMDVVMGDVNGILRLLPEETAVTPFVTAGAGFVRYDPEGEDALVVDAANARIPDTEGDDNGGNAETRLAGTIGVGADIQPEGWPVAIRGEITDDITSSPAMVVLGDEDILPGGADVEGDDDFGIVHNLGLTLGLQWFPGQN